MGKVSGFNKKQDKVLQWATVLNAFVSCLFLLGQFTVTLLWMIRGGGWGVGGVKGALIIKMLNLVHHFGQHSL